MLAPRAPLRRRDMLAVNHGRAQILAEYTEPADRGRDMFPPSAGDGGSGTA